MNNIGQTFIVSVIILMLCFHGEGSTKVKSNDRIGNNHLLKNNLIAMCSRIPSFLRKNTMLRSCYKINRNTMHIAYNASLIAARECENQFRFRPWNCTQESVPKIANHAFPETAYLFAIHSASLAYSLAYACSYGLIENCKCSGPVAEKYDLKTHTHVEDKLCAQKSIKYGIEKSRELLKNVKERDTRSLVDEHNKEAGRRALVTGELDKKSQLCRCHGVSGACSVKKCISRLPKMPVVSSFLLSRYKAAVKVGVDNYGKELIPSEATLVGPTNEDLVFTEQSPNFCTKNLGKGSMGTVSRECKVHNNSAKNNNDPESCKVLCCNRGYKPVQQIKMEPCNCVFTYCCNVTCQSCQRNVTTHVCN